jgi:hypothetical protein
MISTVPACVQLRGSWIRGDSSKPRAPDSGGSRRFAKRQAVDGSRGLSGRIGWPVFAHPQGDALGLIIPGLQPGKPASEGARAGGPGDRPSPRELAAAVDFAAGRSLRPGTVGRSEDDARPGPRRGGLAGGVRGRPQDQGQPARSLRGSEREAVESEEDRPRLLKRRPGGLPRVSCASSSREFAAGPAARRDPCRGWRAPWSR